MWQNIPPIHTFHLKEPQIRSVLEERISALQPRCVCSTMPRVVLCTMQGVCMQRPGSGLLCPVWDVQPRISAVVVTTVWLCHLEDGLSCKLWVWWLFFSPWQLVGFVGAKISRARSRTISLTGFGLDCWHHSEAMSDEAAELDGACCTFPWGCCCQATCGRWPWLQRGPL